MDWKKLVEQYEAAVQSGVQGRVTVARVKIIHAVAEELRGREAWPTIRERLAPVLHAAMSRINGSDDHMAHFEFGQLDALMTLLGDGMPREDENPRTLLEEPLPSGGGLVIV